jgi:hypothetical protein
MVSCRLRHVYIYPRPSSPHLFQYFVSIFCRKKSCS